MLRLAALAVAAAACGASSPPPSESPPPSSADAAPAVASEEPGGTPCFGGPPLVATTIYSQLERFAPAVHIWDGRSPLPSGRFGSCTVADGKVRDASGTVVAELGCGIGVRQRGIVDHLGLQIGAAGSEILAREQSPGERLVCVIGKRTECWLRSSDDDVEPRASYVLTDPLPAPDGAPVSLQGDDAIEVLRDRRIERFHMTIYCH